MIYTNYYNLKYKYIIIYARINIIIRYYIKCNTKNIIRYNYTIKG